MTSEGITTTTVTRSVVSLKPLFEMNLQVVLLDAYGTPILTKDSNSPMEAERIGSSLIGTQRQRDANILGRLNLGIMDRDTKVVLLRLHGLMIRPSTKDGSPYLQNLEGPPMLTMVKGKLLSVKRADRSDMLCYQISPVLREQVGKLFEDLTRDCKVVGAASPQEIVNSILDGSDTLDQHNIEGGNTVEL